MTQGTCGDLAFKKKIPILRKKLLYYSTEKSWTVETCKEMLH